MLALFFVPYSLLRYLDDDEGGYGLAARLVGHGRTPYRDFFYPQMPLQPYVYGGWGRLFGSGWYSLRVLAALLATALGVLVYIHVRGRHGRRIGAVALLLYGASSLVFGWMPLVKPHVMTALLAFAAYAAAATGRSRRHWAAAGVLAGLAVDARLLAAAVAATLVVYALRSGAGPLGAYLAGLVIGLLPSILFLVVDADRFVFDNVGANAARSDAGLVGNFGQKLTTATNLIGIGTTEGAIGGRAFGPQFLLLLIVATAAIALALTRERRLPAAYGIALALGVACFLPTPAYTQYFAIVVPFLVVAASDFVADVASHTGNRPPGPALKVLAFVALAAYLALAPIDLFRYSHVAGSEDARLSAVRAVSRVVRANTSAGEEVLTSWPGYLVGTETLPVPGTESDFAPHDAAALDPGRPQHYHMATAGEIDDWIRHRRTRIIVVKLWNILPPYPDWSLAPRSGYRVLARIGDAVVYRAE